METDYISQIRAHINALNELAANSESSIRDIEEYAALTSTQVGDYALPIAQGDPINELVNLDKLIDDLSANLSVLNTDVDGARVPVIPSDLYDITPDDMVNAICSIDNDIIANRVIDITSDDINNIDFCAPESIPAPQITMDDFLRLCEDVQPPDKPRNVATPANRPNMGELLADLASVPVDDPGDRTELMRSTFSSLENQLAYGLPIDVAIDDLSVSEVGRLILASSDINSSTEFSDVLPDVLDRDGLYQDIKNADLDLRDEYPEKPDGKVAVDCVAVMMPIIEESQKKSGRFTEVKKEISNIEQMALIGSIFVEFWNSVNDTLSDNKLVELNRLGDEKYELEKKKIELDKLYGAAGGVVAGAKTEHPLIAKIKKDIDLIVVKQNEILNSFTITIKDLARFQNLDDILNTLVRDLSVEIEITYGAYKSPKFHYNIAKRGSDSDRRLQKLQRSLVDSVKRIDMKTMDGVNRIQEIQKNFDKDYNSEINRVRREVGKLGINWALYAIVDGGEFREFLRKETTKRLVESRTTYEPVVKKYNALKIEDDAIQSYMNNLPQLISDELNRAGCDPVELGQPPLDAGHDINYKNIPMNARTSPNIFDMRWWRKFCTLASVVNLAPVHWPVGLILPTIPRPLFIPCPIIWTPLAVFNTPFALIVILIGQCGILPSPFVFVLNTAPFPLGPLNPRSCWFPVAIRPMCHIKDNPRSERLLSAPLLQIPMVNLAALKSQIDIIKGQISINLKQIEDNSDLVMELNIENDPDQQRRLTDLADSTQGLLAKNAGLLRQVAALTSVMALGPLTATIELDPSITKSMPLYVDDFPTWERLSLSNIPFLSFLWKWCAAGKNGGGFLRDPI